MGAWGSGLSLKAIVIIGDDLYLGSEIDRHRSLEIISGPTRRPAWPSPDDARFRRRRAMDGDDDGLRRPPLLAETESMSLELASCRRKDSDYPEPTACVLFSGAAQLPPAGKCQFGFRRPFYCPGDQKVLYRLDVLSTSGATLQGYRRAISPRPYVLATRSAISKTARQGCCAEPHSPLLPAVQRDAAVDEPARAEPIVDPGSSCRRCFRRPIWGHFTAQKALLERVDSEEAPLNAAQQIGETTPSSGAPRAMFRLPESLQPRPSAQRKAMVFSRGLRKRPRGSLATR